MLIAGADTPLARLGCASAGRRSVKSEAVKVVVYEGALQAFDIVDLPARMEGPFGAIGHDPNAADAAWREIMSFLSPP
jgi:hypothetical protein